MRDDLLKDNEEDQAIMKQILNDMVDGHAMGDFTFNENSASEIDTQLNSILDDAAK